MFAGNTSNATNTVLLQHYNGHLAGDNLHCPISFKSIPTVPYAATAKRKANICVVQGLVIKWTGSHHKPFNVLPFAV